VSRRTAIVFIDGNNLYHNLKGLSVKPSHIDLSKLSELACAHFNCDYKESRYYNSIPDLKDNERVYYEHLKFFEDIRKLPKFRVFTRKLQSYTTKRLLQEKKEVLSQLELCDACKPIVEANCFDCIGKTRTKEKGIDVMIAVDMLNLCALEGEYDYCILISGDADFVPASEIVRRHGKEVFSAFIPRGYSWELRNKLNFWTISTDFLLGNCLKKNQA